MEAKLSVRQVVEAIEQLEPRERIELIMVLPAALKISPDDYGWLKASESAFGFWDNEDDAIYDRL